MSCVCVCVCVCVYVCECVCVSVCQVFLIHIIHNTYRLRLLIVPYAKASPNATEPRKIL